jgi:hypothetical protein
MEHVQFVSWKKKRIFVAFTAFCDELMPVPHPGCGQIVMLKKAFPHSIFSSFPWHPSLHFSRISAKMEAPGHPQKDSRPPHQIRRKLSKAWIPNEQIWGSTRFRASIFPKNRWRGSGIEKKTKIPFIS